MTNDDTPTKSHSDAMLDAYRLFFNFYDDGDQNFATLADFLADPDIAATLTITELDDNAMHIYFDYDTCAVYLIALFNEHDYMTSIKVSTDNMPYESLILDANRR